ncbi:MAG: HNH nuclease family protein [Gammaproteobacteria bacterium]|nr:MAG: HNH nuclease family protein [Gammaproteobacteria bacterium]RKZ40950.1 MAG: HNH nuclease family protein [Gammaproteobacteria bacterium]RKZ74865.1 MAG: HNH nuclease family protein [Gammaproteobacteria bacterium]
MLKKKKIDKERLNKTVIDARKNQEQRERGYREQALKLYPWICTRCTREFNRQNIIELTVHHKDHNHDNNPTDGSNWELLCIYCHENEHSRSLDAEYGELVSDNQPKQSATHTPFADLKALLNKNT